MKAVLHISWEYPPFVVGGLSQELRRILPPLAKSVPVVLVVRAGSDGNSEVDGMKVYRVAQSVFTCPHILAYAHVMNVDLLRGASRAIHELGGVSIVHCHDWISALSGIFLKTNFGMPLVISVYSTELTRSRTLSSLLSMGIFDMEKHCFQQADALVAARPLAGSLASDYGIEHGRIYEAGCDLRQLYGRLL
jgi:glycogen synthase